MTEPELDLELPREKIVVRRIPWRQHRAWLDHNWQSGQHVSIIVRTGGGKSYLVRYGLLPLWQLYRVLILDMKGGRDETLEGWGELVDEYPAREREAEDYQQPGERIYRLVVPEFEFNPRKRDTEGMQKAREVAGKALDECYKAGHWLVYVDEAQPLCDSQNSYGLGLQGPLRQIWQRGRSRGVTLVAATQEPLWVPNVYYSQPTHLYIGAEVDPGSEHLRDIGGDRRAVVAALAALRQHEFLFISREPRAMWITKVGR